MFDVRNFGHSIIYINVSLCDVQQVQLVVFFFILIGKETCSKRSTPHKDIKNSRLFDSLDTSIKVPGTNL